MTVGFGRTLRLTVALAFALLPTPMASAVGFVALDLPARLAAAQDIALGTIDDVDVIVRDGEPWTLVRMTVERAWRRGGENQTDPNDVGDAILTAAFWGGAVVGGPALQVAGMPDFAVGERVLWLLRSPDAGLGAATVGVTQGVFRPRGGAWVGDDGATLGVGDDGALALGGAALPDAVIFDALAAALGLEAVAP